jgi:hypothetical protein
MLAPIKKPNATSFILRNPTRRWASASGSAPANDSGKEARARAAPVGGAVGFNPAAGESDASGLSEALCATTPSSIAAGS